MNSLTQRASVFHFPPCRPGSRGLPSNDVPVSRKRSGIEKPPAYAGGSSLIQQGAAYLLTWTVPPPPPALPPRPPAGPPVETILTQSSPSPL